MQIQTLKRGLAAYAIHLYTASGLLWAYLTLFSILSADYRSACLWMLVAVAVDSTDGFLARRFQIGRVLPHIDGRKLDDIVDFLNYTFLPLLLLGHAAWVPEPPVLWLSIAAIASLFAFAHTGAKEEEAGFFLGFPSYWNLFAIYVVLWLHELGESVIVGLLLLLSLFSLLPVRFVYPSRAPKFPLFFNLGGLIWIILLTYLLWVHPEDPGDLVLASLTYPILYVLLSLLLDLDSRRSGERKGKT